MNCNHDLMVDTATIHRETGRELPIYGGDTLGNEWRWFKCLQCGLIIKDYVMIRGEKVVQNR